MHRLASGLLFGVALLFANMNGAAQLGQPYSIIDDDRLSSAVASARAEFLRGKHFDRLDASILVKERTGVWRQGSFNGDHTAYPASCVKLAYLAAAMHFLHENNQPYEALDKSVRPMVTVSSNYATGEVVDAITSAPNIADLMTTGPQFDGWFQKRLYTERFLESRGLLGNQKTANKTYPTNSGEGPTGAEKVAVAVHGRNAMQPVLAARLMLQIQNGSIEPGANSYMRSLLRHKRWGANSIIGRALPPGSTYENKPGVAYDTVEDIAYVGLPNEREFILAVFTNSYEDKEPSPDDSSLISGFCERLLDKTDLLSKCPPRIIADDSGPEFESIGDWQTETSGTQHRGSAYHFSQAGKAREASWIIGIPQDGKYELCAWYPKSTDSVTSAAYSVSKTTSGPVYLNQQHGGGRWMQIGDYDLKSGPVRVKVTAAADTSGTLVADAIRAWRWPDPSELTR